MIKNWKRFVEGQEAKNEVTGQEFKIKERPKVIKNKMMVADLLDELDLDDPDFKKRFMQNNPLVAKNFILVGAPSEWYLMELIDYLQSKGVEVPEEIWK